MLPAASLKSMVEPSKGELSRSTPGIASAHLLGVCRLTRIEFSRIRPVRRSGTLCFASGQCSQRRRMGRRSAALVRDFPDQGDLI
jgi:hypothetical protein